MCKHKSYNKYKKQLPWEREWMVCVLHRLEGEREGKVFVGGGGGGDRGW